MMSEPGKGEREFEEALDAYDGLGKTLREMWDLANRTDREQMYNEKMAAREKLVALHRATLSGRAPAEGLTENERAITETMRIGDPGFPAYLRPLIGALVAIIDRLAPPARGEG